MGPATEISGGSAANTIAGVASFGGNAAFVGTVNPPHLSGVEGTTTEKVAWLAFLKVEVRPVK